MVKGVESVEGEAYCAEKDGGGTNGLVMAGIAVRGGIGAEREEQPMEKELVPGKGMGLDRPETQLQ